MSISLPSNRLITVKIRSPPVPAEIPVGPVIHTILSPQEYSEVKELEQDRHSHNSLRAYLSDWTL